MPEDLDDWLAPAFAGPRARRNMARRFLTLCASLEPVSDASFKKKLQQTNLKIKSAKKKKEKTAKKTCKKKLQKNDTKNCNKKKAKNDKLF